MAGANKVKSDRSENEKIDSILISYMVLIETEITFFSYRKNFEIVRIVITLVALASLLSTVYDNKIGQIERMSYNRLKSMID